MTGQRKPLKPGTRYYRYGGYVVRVVVRREDPDHEALSVVRAKRRMLVRYEDWLQRRARGEATHRVEIRNLPVDATHGAARGFCRLPERLRQRIRDEAERLDREVERRKRLAEQGVEVVEKKVEPATWHDLRKPQPTGLAGGLAVSA